MEWINAKVELPKLWERVLVIMDAGVVANPAHPGFRTGKWIDYGSLISEQLFDVEAVGTGRVTHWAPIPEQTLSEVKNLRLSALEGTPCSTNSRALAREASRREAA